MKKQDGKLIVLGSNADTGEPFTIPVTGAATKTLGIFGKKGSGKTWTAAAFAACYSSSFAGECW